MLRWNLPHPANDHAIPVLIVNYATTPDTKLPINERAKRTIALTFGTRGKKFGLLFVDGDHFYVPIRQDFDHWVSYVMKGGGYHFMIRVVLGCWGMVKGHPEDKVILESRGTREHG